MRDTVAEEETLQENESLDLINEAEFESPEKTTKNVSPKNEQEKESKPPTAETTLIDESPTVKKCNQCANTRERNINLASQISQLEARVFPLKSKLKISNAEREELERQNLEL